VDEDRGCAGEHIVRVEVVDGEVVDSGVLGCSFDGGDLDPGAGGGLQPLAGLQVGGVDPAVRFGGPEGVVVGCYEGAGVVSVGAVGVDGDADEVLLAFDGVEVGDGFGCCCSGFGVGGEDEVAGLEFVDGFAGAVGE
jgi:hypothetical protein